MISSSSGEFLGNRTWFESVIGGQDVVLRHTSALECLELFPGYLNGKKIDVYAKTRGKYENINYAVVDSFDGLETVRIGGVRCTSASQTVNDMLDDFNNIDEQSLAEALCNYYFDHGESFEGLEIAPRNMARFEEIKDWAMEYHSVG
jgi:hypothetical protein